MRVSWPIPCGLAYGGEIPYAVDNEITRLRKLLGTHCLGPYDSTGVKIGIAIFVDGKDQPHPIKRGGIRLEPLKKNFVCAGIYLREADWGIPIIKFRFFLWKAVEKALWACAEILKREQIQIDESKLKQQLSLVESDFLSVDLKHGESTSQAGFESMPIDEYRKDEEHRLIVQYRIEGHGNGRDHDKRVAVEDLLGKFLENAGLGYCDGGDVGSGTMNVFCFVKPKGKVGEKIINVLRKNDLLEGAIIVETIKGDETVIWPPDFAGEFSVL